MYLPLLDFDEINKYAQEATVLGCLKYAMSDPKRGCLDDKFGLLNDFSLALTVVPQI